MVARRAKIAKADLPNTLRAVGERMFGLTFYEHQRLILDALMKPNASVAWKASHGAGKTLIQGVAETGFPIIFNDGQVIDTAPTYKQVRGQIWKEVHKLLARSKGIQWPKPHRTRWAPVESQSAYRFAVGMTAEDESHFQGEHGRILFNVNEAQAVKDHIHRAIDNNRAAGDIRRFLVGNSTVTEGAFFRAFNAERHLWFHLTTTAWDTPNLYGLNEAALLAMPLDDGGPLDENPWPTVTRRWVREKLDLWGADHPLYRIKVMAEFPDQDEWQLVAASWLDQAEQDLEGWEAEDLIVGCDPAGSGNDETSLYAFRGGQRVGDMHTVDEDPRGQVMRFLDGLGGKDAVTLIRGDPSGVGYYLLKFVADQGYKVQHVHAQHVTSDPGRFATLKDEMHWKTRERFERGEIGGVTDPTTQAQLARIRWGLDPKGRIVIEGKKKGVKSPDRAEALIMAVGTPGERARPLFGKGGLNDAASRRDDDDRAFRPPLYELTHRAGGW